MHLDDTIVAVSTPPGRGGIGIVRLAGSEAKPIALPLLRLKHALEPNRSIFGELIEPKSGERVDEVVVTYFAKPHSYTTDDIIEISAHGSPVVLRHIVAMCIAAGARLAEPGEFTMRAFVNGRLDLTQAEAVRDLIDSQTLFQAKAAAQQLQGALSNRLKPLKEKLIQLIAVLEAGVDFAEDDVSVLPDEEILKRLAEVRQPLEGLERSFAFGKIVHEGVTLAIVGRPNVGKSSLFNRLLERERAIVTEIPGTTRDLVTETVAIGGIPVKLIDTAGLRESVDRVESIGMEKTREALADADVVLIVLEFGDAASQKAFADEMLTATRDRHRIVVMNKVDIAGDDLSVSVVPDASQVGVPPLVMTSALTGAGIDDLRAAILKLIGGDAPSQSEPGFLTNARQHGLVNDSLRGLEAAQQTVQNRVPHEMLLLDLYAALKPLDAITGQTTADDILNLVFSTFCIGK